MNRVVAKRRVSVLVSVWIAVPVGLVSAVGAQAPTPSGREACQGLARLELPDARVVSAEAVPAGGFTPPADLNPWLAGDPTLYKRLAPFCRAVVRAAPSADSDIQIEVWLPATGWNGKLLSQGNGGFAGEINFGAMAGALDQGYATAGTDTGHSGGSPDASWAIGHPEKVTDFGYRGIHVMTQLAKAAIQGYYGSKPRYSYFASCSNGGRQALMEAQRFPEDYDGILAGAPASFWTHLLAKVIADAQATTLDPASYISASKIPALARAVNAACDAADGLTDGVLNDPRRCRFDPATLACKGGEADTCLTAPQVAALEKLYAGPRDSGGRPIFPGTLPGAEEGNGGWATWITGSVPGDGFLLAAGKGFFGSMVFERADWSYRTANIDQVLRAAEEKTAAQLDATDADLTAFKARGGKLILHQGWNDPAIPALATIGYFDSVTARLGRQETDAFVRLYMVPGMQHCGDGPGANSFGQWGPAPASDSRHSVALALERWVEQGEAPSSIVATKFVDDDPAKGVQSTRPLCPYPQIARYDGQGDSRDAGSFACIPGGDGGTAQPAMARNSSSAPTSLAPIAQYLMDRTAEIALARSAAPESIALDAEVLVLGRHGFEPAVRGKNGFVCLVERSWTSTADPDFWDPKVRTPICWNAAGARSVLNRNLRRTALILAGRTKAQVDEAIVAAVEKRDLPAPESGAMCYMMSKRGYGGDSVEHWPPHLMFYFPLTDPAIWGANLPGSPVFAFSDPREQATTFVIAVQRWSDGTEPGAGASAHHE